MIKPSMDIFKCQSGSRIELYSKFKRFLFLAFERKEGMGCGSTIALFFLWLPLVHKLMSEKQKKNMEKKLKGVQS